MKDLFLDTNIIIDVLANRQPFSVAAARLFDLAEKLTCISLPCLIPIFTMSSKRLAQKRI